MKQDSEQKDAVVIEFVERRGLLLTPREAGIAHIMQTVELLQSTIEVHRGQVPEAMDVHASISELRRVLEDALGPMWHRRSR